MTPPSAIAARPAAIPAARAGEQAASGAGPLVLSERPQRSLSPSRAADFASCPLLYRFRAIDRLPEPPSPAATRGTLVHLVLEQLFDLPAPRRTLAAARELVPGAWAHLVGERPELTGPDGEPLSWCGPGWWAGVEPLLANYFQLEDPASVAPIGDQPAAPVGREVPISTELPSGLVLRGYVDRLDASADGLLRVVDYKTGRSPGTGHEGRAMFQLRFYALALLHARGVVAAELRLMYLADGVALRFEPDRDDLARTGARIEALWAAIESAADSGVWRANPSGRCNWCAHRPVCPAWGGQPPERAAPAAGPDLSIDLTEGA